jgi:hypothetical protein
LRIAEEEIRQMTDLRNDGIEYAGMTARPRALRLVVEALELLAVFFEKKYIYSAAKRRYKLGGVRNGSRIGKRCGCCFAVGRSHQKTWQQQYIHVPSRARPESLASHWLVDQTS